MPEKYCKYVLQRYFVDYGETAAWWNTFHWFVNKCSGYTLTCA